MVCDESYFPVIRDNCHIIFDPIMYLQKLKFRINLIPYGNDKFFNKNVIEFLPA